MKKETIYLCTVMCDGQYQGRQFRLKGKAELIEFGFSVASVKQKLVRKREGILKGIHLSAMSAQEFRKHPHLMEVYRTNWQDISALFKRTPHLFRLKHRTLIGLMTEGLHQGERIALFAIAEVAPYFCTTSVRKAAKNRTVHGGIQWQYAKNMAEAEQYRQEEERQREILSRQSQLSRHGRLWRHRHQGIHTGKQAMQYCLVQAQSGFSTDSDPRHLNSIILLHQALGLYQTHMAWKYDDTRIGQCVAYLSDMLSPKKHKEMLNVTKGTLIHHVIALLIKRLAEI